MDARRLTPIPCVTEVVPYECFVGHRRSAD